MSRISDINKRLQGLEDNLDSDVEQDINGSIENQADKEQSAGNNNFKAKTKKEFDDFLTNKEIKNPYADFLNSEKDEKPRRNFLLSPKFLLPLSLAITIICCTSIILLNINNKTNYDFLNSEQQASTEISTIKVCVKGEVKNPGVISIESNKRVQDAIEKAGGFTKNANKNAVNLAKILVDGEEINVPSIQESSAKGESNQGKININLATKEELKTLKGIGDSLAERIIEYRKKYGFFSSIEELKNVKGIGDSLFAKNKDMICV